MRAKSTGSTSGGRWPPLSKPAERPGQRYGIRRALKEFLFGLFLYELYQETAHIKAKYEDLFLSLVMGELLGLPFLTNYYTLRLLPYVVGDLMKVKRRLLREHDILELLHEGPAAH